MRYGLPALAVVLVGLTWALSPGRAQVTAPRTTLPVRDELPEPVLKLLRAKFDPELESWSRAYVVERCAEHLATINEADRSRIRYFTLHDVPKQALAAMTGSLMYMAPSASRATILRVPQPVPNTDNRIFWLDLTWYYWTAEAWSHMASADPYFREPLVTTPGLKYLQQYGPGDQVLRGDWWLYYVADTTLFLGKGETRADDAFLYHLVYGKDRIPKTAAEFEKFWRVDNTLLQEHPTDMGAIIDEGDSAVSWSNRLLWRRREARGVYWRTFDVFRTAGDQDFMEHPYPREVDGGEHIFQTELGVQHYLLSDGKGNRVEFGDPRLVRDHVSGGPGIVITMKSCMHCHVEGIITFKNSLQRLHDTGVRLSQPDLRRKERYHQFFLQPALMAKAVKQDQENYIYFIRQVNGLTCQQNATQFGFARNWYAGPLDLAQMAREHGVAVPELRDALGYQSTNSRLSDIALNQTTMPRVTWERGGYQESGLLLLAWRAKRKIDEKHVLEHMK